MSNSAVGEGERFDAIVAADVLEYLVRPVELSKRALPDPLYLACRRFYGTVAKK